jgi:hypothetical protein
MDHNPTNYDFAQAASDAIFGNVQIPEQNYVESMDSMSMPPPGFNNPIYSPYNQQSQHSQQFGNPRASGSSHGLPRHNPYFQGS